MALNITVENSQAIRPSFFQLIQCTSLEVWAMAQM